MDPTRTDEMSKSLRNGAAHTKSSLDHKVAEFSEDYLKDAQKKVEQVISGPSEFILKHPYLAVAIAAVGSYFMGSLLRRRSDPH